MFVALTPRYAVTPEVPVSLDRQIELYSALPTVQLPSSLMFASDDGPRKPMMRTARGDTRPARMIDEALRQRARDAVQRTLTIDDVLSDPA